MFDNCFTKLEGDLISGKIGGESATKLRYTEMLYAQHNQLILLERHIVSVMDFLCAINTQSNDKPIIDKNCTSKFYEYNIVLKW